jgi:hypothetical protein
MGGSPKKVYRGAAFINILQNLNVTHDLIAINRHKPTLNHGTKASKELLIFN